MPKEGPSAHPAVPKKPSAGVQQRALNIRWVITEFSSSENAQRVHNARHASNKQCLPRNIPSLLIIQKWRMKFDSYCHSGYPRSNSRLRRTSVANLIFTLHQAACIGARCEMAKPDVVRRWTK